MMAMLSVGVCSGQTVVKDAEDGSPVVQASVYDERGMVLGETDMEGKLPPFGRLPADPYQSYSLSDEGR